MTRHTPVTGPTGKGICVSASYGPRNDVQHVTDIAVPGGCGTA